MTIVVSNQPLFQTPYTGSPWFCQGFDIVEMTATTVTLTAGTTRSNNSNFVMQYPGDAPNRSGTYTIDITKLGIGGMFPRVIDYTVFSPGPFLILPIAVIGDSRGKNPVEMMIMDNFQILPEGYDSFSLVSVVFLSSTGLVQVQQTGSSQNRLFNFQIAQVLNNGNANIKTPIDLGFFGVPPGKLIKNIYLNYRYTPAAANNEAWLFSSNDISGPNIIISKGSTGLQRNNVIMAPSDESNIYYQLTGVGDDLDLWISGIEIDIPLFLQYAF